MAKKLHVKILRTKKFIIYVTQKRIRYLYLRMGDQPGHLRVSAPYGTGDKEIFSFVASKSRWIENHGIRLNKEGRVAILSLEEGSSVHIWGKCLCLHFEEEGVSGKISISDSVLYFPLVRHLRLDEKRKFLYQWLGEIFEKEVRIFAEKWAALLKLVPERVEIRKMKTRWGSCTPALRSIRINLFLVHFEKIFLDYVMLHEFVHFLEPSHNARFYVLMDQWMPDWRTIRKKLKENSLTYCNVF